MPLLGFEGGGGGFSFCHQSFPEEKKKQYHTKEKSVPCSFVISLFMFMGVY
jgi:hypothetical protein